MEPTPIPALAPVERPPSDGGSGVDVGDELGDELGVEALVKKDPVGLVPGETPVILPGGLLGRLDAIEFTGPGLLTIELGAGDPMLEIKPGRPSTDVMDEGGGGPRGVDTTENKRVVAGGARGADTTEDKRVGAGGRLLTKTGAPATDVWGLLS